MKLNYHQAVISFCTDLTDPEAESIPIAILLVAETDHSRFGVSITGMPGGVQLDEISKAVLQDVPALLKQHVDEVLLQEPDLDLADILHSAHDSLRNTLHVSAIDEGREIEIPGDNVAQMMGQMLQIAMNRLEMFGGRPDHTAPIPPASIWPLVAAGSEARHPQSAAV